MKLFLKNTKLTLWHVNVTLRFVKVARGYVNCIQIASSLHEPRADLTPYLTLPYLTLPYLVLPRMPCLLFFKKAECLLPGPTPIT